MFSPTFAMSALCSVPLYTTIYLKWTNSIWSKYISVQSLVSKSIKKITQVRLPLSVLYNAHLFLSILCKNPSHIHLRICLGVRLNYTKICHTVIWNGTYLKYTLSGHNTVYRGYACIYSQRQKIQYIYLCAECVIYTKTSKWNVFICQSLSVQYASLSKAVAGTVPLWLCRSHPGRSACNQRWACFPVCSSSRTSWCRTARWGSCQAAAFGSHVALRTSPLL